MSNHTDTTTILISSEINNTCIIEMVSAIPLETGIPLPNVIKAISVSLTGIVTVILNVALWLIILMPRFKLRGFSSWLLLSLTGADLIVGATIPIVAYTALQGAWVFSAALCTLMGFVHMLTFIASVMSLAAISVNRYVSVCHPWQLRTWYTPRRTALWIAGVWLLSALLASPPLLGWCEYGFQAGQSICFATWPNSPSYMAFMVATCFFGPLSTMVYAFMKIYKERRKMMMAIGVVVATSGLETEKDGTSRAQLAFRKVLDRKKELTDSGIVAKGAESAGIRQLGGRHTFYSTVMRKLRLNRIGQQEDSRQVYSDVKQKYKNQEMNYVHPVNNIDREIQNQRENVVYQKEGNVTYHRVNGINTNISFPDVHSQCDMCKETYKGRYKKRSKSLPGIEITTDIHSKRSCHILCSCYSRYRHNCPSFLQAWYSMYSLGINNAANQNTSPNLKIVCRKPLLIMKGPDIDYTDKIPKTTSLFRTHRKPEIPKSRSPITTQSNQQNTLAPPTAHKLSQSMPHNPNINSIKDSKRRQKEEWQLTMSLLLAIIFFFICWFPFCIVMFVTTIFQVSVPVSLDFCSLFFGILNSSINPIIYGIMNKRIRNAFRQLFLCRLC